MQVSASMNDRIRVIKGDITKVSSDAIVNAANSTLMGGGGVDGDIHRIAGPGLLEECKKLNGCPGGEARITFAYKLPSLHVIHTVGPIWKGGHRDEHELLASCYINSLKIARDLKIRSIAFPAISTGAYRFPPDQAANIAITEVRRFISNNNEPDEIIFVLYTDEIYKLYLKLTANG
jgi:O-acetyl-ADP-ribose deacetylase (regulator of RNase III)